MKELNSLLMILEFLSVGSKLFTCTWIWGNCGST